MKLSEYAKHIAEIAKTYPDVEVVYAVDDEGNAFHVVNWIPTLGMFTTDGEFYDSKNEKDAMEETGEFKINAVCIN